MVVISEAFLQHHEHNAIQTALNTTPPHNPITYFRYVDHSHARFNNNENAIQFFNILNNQHPKIQHTMEVESESKTINFLDLLIINDKNGKYEFKIYRKLAITNVQVKPNSGHDPKILKGIFISFLNRAFHMCSKALIKDEM